MQAVDLYDSATFEREIPHDYFAWLRENEPVYWQPPREIAANISDVLHLEQRGYGFARGKQLLLRHVALEWLR